MAGLLQTDFSDKPVENFNQRIAGDPCIMPLIRPVIVAVAQATMGDLPQEQRWSFTVAAAADDYVRARIIAKLQELATMVLTRSGPRQLSPFILDLQEMNLFSGEAVGRLGMLAEENFDAGYLGRRDAVDSEFREVKIPSALVEHLKNVAIASIQESLLDRLGTRLENSASFTDSIKQD